MEAFPARSALWALTAIVLLAGCGVEQPLNARQEVSSIEVTALLQGAGQEIRAGSVDTAWALPGLLEPVVGRRSTRGPHIAASEERTLMHDIVQEIASGFTLQPRENVPYRRLDEAREVRWEVAIPLGSGVEINAFLPANYTRAEDGSWTGEGTVSRDQRWIRDVGDVQDVVFVRLSASFRDQRDEAGGGTMVFDGSGTVSMSSSGHVYDVGIHRRTTMSAVSESSVQERIDDVSEELQRLRSGPGR